MAFEIGQRIGDYEIVRVLGKGGLGQVYAASHVISQRCEALKVLLPEERPGAEVGERFRREIQLLGALSHPNIASLHNAFYHEGQLVMVMELVNGQTLREKSARGRIPVLTIMQYTRQVLSALDYAHSHGVVHRDVKPTNIMITGDDQAKLLDFGIATSDRSADLTAPGFMVGSVNYMSPEQIAGDKATVRSDIYAVGVMLYEILTGVLPAKGATNFEVMRAHMNERPVPPANLDPRLPQSLSSAILKALEKGPADRYASARDFLDALDAVSTSSIYELMSSPTRTLQVPSSQALQAAPSSTNQSSSLTPRSQRSAVTASYPLDDISKKLAVYIGPIASVVIKKLANKCSSLDELYKEAATQISSDTDRQHFLRSKSK
jgi:serine/threonine-protein kinase